MPDGTKPSQVAALIRAGCGGGGAGSRTKRARASQRRGAPSSSETSVPRCRVLGEPNQVTAWSRRAVEAWLVNGPSSSSWATNTWATVLTVGVSGR
ncbi:hypothetical protein SAMN04489747_2596 [Auraticoccus monumenti]|uniref:Uncharacterized protein n=1 Tax=Auraticoccus monumenti TaxID=675864 RepID=A0A1G7AF48_9ACTN|nr:hypothetical protein SAMN04489747_2596 [Auraticoccus monumenti]